MQSQDDDQFFSFPVQSENHKPVVKYRGKPEFIPTADPDGEPWVYARVDAIDHPKLGTCTVRTSMVLSQPNDDGFETMNTIYQREETCE